MPSTTAAPTTAPAASSTASARRTSETSRTPAGEEQLGAAGLLLAAGDPGAGERGPDPDQDGEHRAGAPDGEPAGVVQRDRRAEERADRRVLGQRGQRVGADVPLKVRSYSSATKAARPPATTATTTVPRRSCRTAAA